MLLVPASQQLCKVNHKMMITQTLQIRKLRFKGQVHTEQEPSSSDSSPQLVSDLQMKGWRHEGRQKGNYGLHGVAWKFPTQ